MNETNSLLLALIALVGRVAFPPDQLIEIVCPKGATNIKQLEAYNLCDGTRAQSEIASESNLDRGNFSRTVDRWVDAGVLFRLGEGREVRLLHLYKLSPSLLN